MLNISQQEHLELLQKEQIKKNSRYNVTNSQTKFKNSMLKSSLCDYSDVYILIKRAITAPSTDAANNPNNVGKKMIFKNCAPFTDCISKINNTQIDNAKDIEVVISLHQLLEYTDSYSKLFEIAINSDLACKLFFYK